MALWLVLNVAWVPEVLLEAAERKRQEVFFNHSLTSLFLFTGLITVYLVYRKQSCCED